MSAVEDRLVKLREERMAREKARIEKLRELNLKKYNKNDVSQPQKLVKSNSVSQIKPVNAVKNNLHVKRPITAPNHIKTKVTENDRTTNNNFEPKIEGKTNYLQRNIVALKNFESNKDIKNKADTKNKPSSNTDSKIDKKPVAEDKKPAITNKINNDRLFDRKPAVKTDKILAEIKPFKKIDPKLTRKSMAVPQKPATNIPVPQKSMFKVDSSKESVFERLYKPKNALRKTIDDVSKLQTDPNYLKKVIKTSELILKRHSCLEPQAKDPPVRRSISAVHFKRISKNEAANCIHKWASIGDKLNKQHLTIDEGDSIKEEVFSSVKSERKKVKFMTPMSRFNSPRPDDLQKRLKAWLQKRGKSLDAYQHLQCFGVHHLSNKPFELATPAPQYQPYDEENKENIAVDSDSDDGSYIDNLSKQNDALSQGDKIDVDTWRQTSLTESLRTDFNETADFNETTVTSADTYMNVEDLLVGALNDLTELLREGFEWEQSARYLRALRALFPCAVQRAAYWECRAALEERRGDLHASVQCWEEAIAKGTERNVVEANLDTLLNKFMQLKISPNNTATKRPDPKMVDVKNVFKSTIIRFAVQQAKLRQSETPIFTVTPVRRSGRLSMCPARNNTPHGNTPHGNTPHGNTPHGNTPHGNTPHGNTPHGNTPHGNTPHGNTPHGNTPHGKTPRIPLRLCESVKQVKTLAPHHVFTPNKNLVQTP